MDCTPVQLCSTLKARIMINRKREETHVDEPYRQGIHSIESIHYAVTPACRDFACYIWVGSKQLDQAVSRNAGDAK